jgi:hypothetical protein
MQPFTGLIGEWVKLQFVGDARSASEAAKNWMPGENSTEIPHPPALA